MESTELVEGAAPEPTETAVMSRGLTGVAGVVGESWTGGHSSLTGGDTDYTGSLHCVERLHSITRYNLEHTGGQAQLVGEGVRERAAENL